MFLCCTNLAQELVCCNLFTQSNPLKILVHLVCLRYNQAGTEANCSHPYVFINANRLLEVLSSLVISALLLRSYMNRLEFRIVIIRRWIRELKLIQECVSFLRGAYLPSWRVGFVHSYRLMSAWSRDGFVATIKPGI